MKKILVPVDYSELAGNMLDFVADFSRDFPIEKIILIRSFHVPTLLKLLPSPDMVMVTDEQMIGERESSLKNLDQMVRMLNAKLGELIVVSGQLILEPWEIAIEKAIEAEKPDLLLLGNYPKSEKEDSVLSDKAVLIARASPVPVLLYPYKAVYRKLEIALMPVDFNDLNLLTSFRQLFRSQPWLNADIVVLNIDASGKHIRPSNSDNDDLTNYLEGYRFRVIYAEGKNIPEEILSFAEKFKVQVIFALPGKHSFFYKLTHRLVTEAFARKSVFPVLLLK